jgi:DNA-binding transcriptional LysR family regulator
MSRTAAPKRLRTRHAFDGVEALAALERFGTVSEAATRLRLTQSAVSKRLRVLERWVGFAVTEPRGRRVVLTGDAIHLLERARPLLAELRAVGEPQSRGHDRFSLALADSIAASWGPRVVAAAVRGVSGLSVDLHAHRSVLVLESLRLGRYHIGLSTVAPGLDDLVHHPIVDEPMVLVRATAEAGRDRPLITIEPSSATWRAIEPQLRQHQQALLRRRLVFVESFSAALQMVRAGFGDGLLPLGLALAMKVPRASYRELSRVVRQVALVTRKSVLERATFEALRAGIRLAAERYFSGELRRR